MKIFRSDFPDPVVPAIKTWGILAISTLIGLPKTSGPRPTDSLDLLDCKPGLESIFFKETISEERFGISIPIKDLPGIGASTLTLPVVRSEEHTSELHSLIRISYDV